jgi:PAS domain S-box-containing protein
MKTALLVTPDDERRARLRRALAGYSVFVAASDAEALKTLRLVDIELVVRDRVGPPGALRAFITAVRETAGSAVTIAIGPDADDLDAPDFTIPEGFTERDLEAACRHAAERQRLLTELALLRAQGASAPARVPAASDPERSSDGAVLARVLKEFSRMFATGFDLPSALEVFLNAIGELVRPTRMALLLPTAGGEDYRIAAQRGLPPQLVDSARLSAAEGLARWLAFQGRPAPLRELTDPDIIREMRLLQALVAVPLLAHGELVAILALGQPVVGGAYGRGETETLFDLATQLATAIRDMQLHHQLEREKEFTERILAHMSSGVITLGRDHRVGMLNRRAAEILGLTPAAVVNQDLRALPSPLGDMLFETLRSGQATPRSEIQLALRGLWLEVSTYPVRGEEHAPLGAVLVFEDLTARKELAAQKREAEQFQLLTRVVARIADEIKNPLVSINTFMELIEERYDDPDFRKHFSSVVRRDVRRLVQVFEKLAGLVTEGELNFTAVDVHTLINELATAIELAEEGTGRTVQLDVTRDEAPQMVRVDAGQLRKALSYLVWYLTYKSPAEGARVSVSVARHQDPELGEAVWVLIGSRTATVGALELQRVFDPVQMVQKSLIDVGPAVSQRLIEALGGQLRLRQGRHELSFLVSLPVTA